MCSKYKTNFNEICQIDILNEVDIWNYMCKILKLPEAKNVLDYENQYKSAINL